jgi:murein DD-endopeptidase MepM/ murein hydrolase activator NlpD
VTSSLDPRSTLSRRGFLFSLGSVGLLAGSALAGRRALTARRTDAAVRVQPEQDTPFTFLSTDTVSQAGAFSLYLHSYYADTAVATFNGWRFPLVADGAYLVAIIAAGQPVDSEIEIDPGGYSVHVDASSSGLGQYSYDLPMTVTPTAFPVDEIDLPPSLTNLLDPTVVAQELVQLRATYGAATGPPLWHGLLMQPLQGEITTRFGQARSYNGGPVTGHHSGVDIAAPMGTPVPVAAPGQVAFTGRLAERGNFIAVSHGLGVYTGYAHLSAIGVAVGDAVSMGDIIGRVGTTGLSTGPHLHWECAVGGIHVDALRWTREVLP